MKNTTMTKFQKSIREIVSEHGNALHVADMLEVSYGTVRAWMCGVRKPKLPTKRRIEFMFGVKIVR